MLCKYYPKCILICDQTDILSLDLFAQSDVGLVSFHFQHFVRWVRTMNQVNRVSQGSTDLRADVPDVLIKILEKYENSFEAFEGQVIN